MRWRHDASDPLACFAAQFHHPFDAAGRRLVYLCGHSLGLQPKSAAQYVEQELKDWQRLGVLGHHAAHASVDPLSRTGRRAACSPRRRA